MLDKALAWILLFAAILLEVAGITSMKLSRGFSEPLPSLAVPVFYVFSAVAVILALKRLELMPSGRASARHSPPRSEWPISASRSPCSRWPRSRS